MVTKRTKGVGIIAWNIIVIIVIVFVLTDALWSVRLGTATVHAAVPHFKILHTQTVLVSLTVSVFYRKSSLEKVWGMAVSLLSKFATAL